MYKRQDNTFATPYLYRPSDDGAAVVIESLTKWIGGHGATLGGAVVDSGKFDWRRDPDRFATIARPDPSYHGVVFADSVPVAPFSTRVLANKLRDFGPTLSPYAAHLSEDLVRLSVGIENVDDIIADLDQALARA